jgi:hypothetical protein
MIHFLALHLLRRKIRHGAHQRAGFGLSAQRCISANRAGFQIFLDWLCQAEVQNFDQAIGTDHHVFRFDVTMNNPGRVRR